MKRNKRPFSHICKLFVSFVFILCFCVACGKEEVPIVVENSNVEIFGQTATPVLKEELVSGRYYLVSEGKYYPLFTGMSKQFEGAAFEKTNSSRKMFIDSSREKYIPTLFLGSDDKIIYYSQEKYLDYIVWERFRDEGYTIGLKNIKSMKSNRIYLDFSEDASESTISFADTASLSELEVPYIMIDKIGGVQASADIVNDGMITGLAKNGKYDLDLYVGTNYKHHTAVANVKILRAMELFASVNYKTLQTDIYEIEIPEYLTTGYYTLSNTGLLRVVKDESYSAYTYYNEPLLIQENQTSLPPQYSEYPPLNLFKSEIPGTLGYNAVVKGDIEKGDNVLFKEAAIVQRELYFPTDVDCTIKVITNEHAGECYITIGSKRYYLQPQDGFFFIEYLGCGEQGVLTLTNFFEPIEVSYYGCTEKIPEPEDANEV